VLEGAMNVTSAVVAFTLVTDTEVGESGTLGTVTEFDWVDGSESPISFLATTVKV
jgi:hypothetical protein